MTQAVAASVSQGCAARLPCCAKETTNSKLVNTEVTIRYYQVNHLSLKFVLHSVYTGR
jgi:hypothetical protein